MTRKPIFPTPPPSLLGRRDGRGGVQGGGARPAVPGGGGGGMTPWCDDLVCSWWRLLADRHSLPFPLTLSLRRRWCPSASHHPLTFLFLPALTFPLPFPFPSLGLSLCRPQCPSASPHSFPSLSLGRLRQRSPWTCPVSPGLDGQYVMLANCFARRLSFCLGARGKGGEGGACGTTPISSVPGLGGGSMVGTD